jgi:hypothetical protein
MGVSLHRYDGALWQQVADKCEALGCERPQDGDSIEGWLRIVDIALERAVGLQARLSTQSLPGPSVNPMNAILGPFGSPRDEKPLRAGLRGPLK